MRLTAFVALALTSACSCPREKPATVEVQPPPAPTIPPAPLERLRGALTVEGEHLYLTLCGAERPSKVLGGGVAELREALGSLERGPDAPPVPVEVVGAVRQSPGGGSMVSVSSLNLAFPPGGGGLCELDASYLYKAGGNEPFWAVTIFEGSLRLDSPALDAPLELPATEAVVPGVRGPAWRGERDGRSLQVQLLPGRCWDGMSGAAYPYEAVVTLDGTELRGCAQQGWVKSD